MIKRQQRSTQQDPKKPIKYSLSQWRRKQVDDYITTNPGAKGKKVKLWLQNHEVDPWPQATLKGLNQIIARLQKKKENVSVSVKPEVCVEQKTKMKIKCRHGELRYRQR